MKDKLKIIIDTDMALDDMLAISYLACCPDVEIIGVTVTGTGIAHRQAGAINALNWLDWLGHSNTPVCVGANAPLALSNQYPPKVRLNADQNYGLSLPLSPRKPNTESIPNFYESLINEHKKFSILSIGGMTNIAQLCKSAKIQTALHQLVIMGGALNVPGNIADLCAYYPSNRHAEWNFFIDPAAARACLSHSWAWRLVPLDACEQVPLTANYLQQFKQEAKTPQARAAAYLLEQAGEGFSFFDPLAAMVVAQASENWFHCESMPLSVHTEFDEEDDMTGSIQRASQGQLGEVVTAVQSEYFYRNFLNTLNSEILPGSGSD